MDPSAWFDPAPYGHPFRPWGAAHLTALALAALGVVLVVTLRRRWTRPGRRLFRRTLAGAMMVNELGWHLWNWAHGLWTLQRMLPLHLCSLSLWLGVVLLLSRSRHVYPFVYFLGIGGAIPALLTPDLGPYGFPHYRFVQILLSHGMLLLTPVYCTAVEGFRPTRDDLLRVVVWMQPLLLGVLVLDLELGSNYLYLTAKPGDASPLDWLGPWPWYIVAGDGIAIGICTLLWLPFARRRS